MKKTFNLFTLLVVLGLVLSVVACRNKTQDNKTTEKPTTAETDKPTDAPTDKPTDAPTDKPTTEHVHVWNEGVITTPPSCTTKGVKTYSCECGETKTEEVDALGHDLVDDEAIAPTCTTAGKEAGKHCTRCDYTEGGEEVSALGHVASTELYYDDNSHYNICTECGYTLDFQELTPGVDLSDSRWTQLKYTSSWETMSGQMRVREKDGSTVVNMAAGWSMTNQYVFNYEGEKPIAKGNSFSIDLGNYFGGAMPMGVKVSLITKVNGENYTIYVLGDKDNFYDFHVTTGLETFTLVSDTEVDVYEIRITNKSLNDGNYYLYMDNLKIFTAMNKASHNFEVTSTTPATCLEKGSTVYTCACGKTYTEEAEALGHDLVDDLAVPATCTTAGSEAGKHCSRCDYPAKTQEQQYCGAWYECSEGGCHCSALIPSKELTAFLNSQKGASHGH